MNKSKVTLDSPVAELLDLIPNRVTPPQVRGRIAGRLRGEGYETVGALADALRGLEPAAVMTRLLEIKEIRSRSAQVIARAWALAPAEVTSPRPGGSAASAASDRGAGPGAGMSKAGTARPSKAGAKAAATQPARSTARKSAARKAASSPAAGGVNGTAERAPAAAPVLAAAPSAGEATDAPAPAAAPASVDGSVLGEIWALVQPRATEVFEEYWAAMAADDHELAEQVKPQLVFFDELLPLLVSLRRAPAAG